MNNYLKKRRAVGLIIVLGFLLIVSILAFAVLVLFQSQHGVTYSLLGLDEIRYAGELGFRHALWVWRYKYDDPDYLNGGLNTYDTTLDFESYNFESYNVSSVRVRVEDKDLDRRLDIGEGIAPHEREIEIWVNKEPWSF